MTKNCTARNGNMCRECIRKWHKMQPGRELSQVQQEYLVDVIMTWIQNEMDLHKGE